MYDYYQISARDLGRDAKIPVRTLQDSDEVFYTLATEMVDTIRANNAAGKKTVFICPVGPVGQYPIFVRLVNSERLSLKNCWFFNMDEYLNDDGTYIDSSSPLSFRGFMQRTVYSQIDEELLMPENQRVFPNPDQPDYGDKLIEELGGVDICFGGIGINGHLAFNEAQPELTPEEFAQLPTRKLKLTPETRTANSIGDRGGAIEAMPSYAITIGIKQILAARKVRLGVFRDWHRSVVRRAAYGEISAAFPVTLLQNHPDAMIYTNSVAAGQPFYYSEPRTTLFKNALVYTDGKFVKSNLLVKDGVISEIGDVNKADECVDLQGKKIVPGFIDMHTHGGADIDVNAASCEDFHKLGQFYASNGVTGWLCSILTDTPEQTLHAIGEAKKTIAGPVDGAKLLGIHLEGPFLATEYKGAMPEELLQKGNTELFNRYQAAAEGAIKYITVSPEVEGVVDMISDISKDVVVGIGHSGADYETAVAAIEAGAATATHTFNAMGLFHQHRPAIMGAVLEKDVYCEAICDGRHLHPGSVRMLLSCKGYDKVVAVTDSMQAAGLPDGDYKLGVNDVVVVDGDAKLKSTGVRAGSTLTMSQAMQNLVRFTGEPLEKVLPLLTANPAKLLGIFDKKGSLSAGKDADFVVLSEDLSVEQTYVAGSCVFKA